MAMFHVEFIKFTDWQPDAQVVQRMPGDHRTFDEAIHAGTMANSGVIQGAVGFRVVESNFEGGKAARVVAHRFRGL